MNRLPPPALQYAGLALAVLGLGATVYALLVAQDSPLHKAYAAHAARLEKQCRLLYLKYTGAWIAQRQLLGVLAAIVLFLFVLNPLLLVVAAFVAVVPSVYLASQVETRRRAIDAQLDAFLTTLANALKASPSLGDALATTATLMRVPIKDDIEFALKENRLGTPLDQALTNMSNRIESRAFNTALTTILIGRQTGGDLPRILERSAATLREMARLEGVVCSKTAEGRAQAYVLGVIPFVIILALNAIDPNWLAPLTASALGYGLMGASAALWIAAIFAARKILHVDI